jgi:hypothetical protein
MARQSAGHQLFAKRDPCTTASLGNAMLVREGGLELRGTKAAVPIEFDWMTVLFECYSDTFDPCGPKTK